MELPKFIIQPKQPLTLEQLQALANMPSSVFIGCDLSSSLIVGCEFNIAVLTANGFYQELFVGVGLPTEDDEAAE